MHDHWLNPKINRNTPHTPSKILSLKIYLDFSLAYNYFYFFIASTISYNSQIFSSYSSMILLLAALWLF